MNFPVIDIHCDLLSYLQDVPNANPWQSSDIGCTVSDLEKGNVKLQVMAIYTATEKGSSTLGLGQSRLFNELLTNYRGHLSTFDKDLEINKTIITTIAAIENAAGFCEEDDALEDGFRKLETIIHNTGRILYMGLTHHGENRFGGGNATKTGLKKDGEALLNYLNGKGIAIDLSHTSDALADDLLNYILKHNLQLSVIASHSNFRAVYDHPRNLPDDIAKEIIKRKGLIGINLLRAFLNNENPDAIYDHIEYGLGLGASQTMCFGADYFYTASHPDQSRKPFFFPEHDNASRYPSILSIIATRFTPLIAEDIACKNVIRFIKS